MQSHPAHTLSHARTLLRSHGTWLALTGAGVSAPSGIPGYRDARGQWMRACPMTHQAFLSGATARRRYWSRSIAGWPLVRDAAPNAAHAGVAALQRAGHVAGVVTQNVDGLHERAGSAHVIDLHGRIDTVVCVDCGRRMSRDAMQALLLDANTGFDGHADIAPDGDAEADGAAESFVVPDCAACGGVLKPDVVFYGANVPSSRVELACAALDACAGLLVAGSSLMTWSGYRFCLRAHAAGKPILAVNLGLTRADALLACKVEADCAHALPALAASLGSR